MQIFNKHNQSNFQDNYVLVGPPNVGKSTFFNKLTWKISPVANMDHYTTTVNKASLRGENNINIIDLPGLTTFSHTGFDEEVTINYLLDNYYKGAINIISAISLKRDLLLTVRLAEAGILNNIVVNMVDELAEEDKLNLRQLEIKFKVPVCSISAKKGHNIDGAIATALNSAKKRSFSLKYNERIEAFLEDFKNILAVKRLSRRFIGLEALQNKDFAIDLLKKEGSYDEFVILKQKHCISKADVDSINQIRGQFIEEVASNTKSKDENFEARAYYAKYKKFDNLLMNPWVAIPGFILLMALIYFLTFYQYTGGYIQGKLADGFEQLQTIIKGAIDKGNTTSAWWAGFVADGLLGGVFTILGFLPWVLILFISISIIEQVGILSRLSIVFDSAFKKSGLSGRALINLTTGIGCNIPGILLSRNISNKKERIISVMTAPLISCSARIVVYGWISKQIFTSGVDLGWLLSFGMTIGSVLLAIFIATFFSRTLFRHNSSLFIAQVPKWRGLDFVVIMKRTLMEMWNFVKRTIIIVSCLNLLVWFLISTGPVNTFILDISDDTHIENSFLFYISYPFRYLLYPVGLGFDFKWSVAILSSFPAKETASSTLETLFGTGFKDAWISGSHGYPVAVLVSFLIFFTFFAPCMATVVVMKKEIGLKHTMTTIGYSLLFTYCLSWAAFLIIASFYMVFNNSVTYNYVPLVLIIICLIAFILFILYSFVRESKRRTRFWGRKTDGF